MERCGGERFEGSYSERKADNNRKSLEISLFFFSSYLNLQEGQFTRVRNAPLNFVTRGAVERRKKEEKKVGEEVR